MKKTLIGLFTFAIFTVSAINNDHIEQPQSHSAEILENKEHQEAIRTFLKKYNFDQVKSNSTPQYDYLKPQHEQYQDIIINNVIVAPGVRPCAQRYEAIKEFLKKYNRPFTMLDIGASQGYFSFRTAHDFPNSSCVMIEGNYSPGWQIAEQLQDLCSLNTDLHNIIFLQKKISIDDLVQLGYCEHFDVTLLLNLAHHFGSAWKNLLDAVFSLGDHVIIETPTAQENSICGPIEDYIKNKGGILICETPRHTKPHLKGKMYLVQGKKSAIQKSYWSQISLQNNWSISSDFDKKTLTKKNKDKVISTDWLPGINLMTFKMLHGSFPTVKTIENNLLSLNYQNHLDPFLWNMIIKGNNISLIDCCDNSLIGRFDTKKCILFNQKLLAMEDPNDIKNFLKGQPHWKMCIHDTTAPDKTTPPTLLIKIPTRSRPEQFFKMLDLYYQKLSNEIHYHFLISCDNNDLKMNNQKIIERLNKYPHLTVTFNNNNSKIEAYNRDLEKTDFDIVLITSDDMKPVAQNYDKIIIDTMLKYFPDLDGVLNFNDGHLTSQCNTMPIFGKKYYDRFGFAYHPSYKSLWCDAEFTFVSRLLRKEKTFTTVLMQHEHPVFGKTTTDDLYEHNNKYYESDKKIFFERVKNHFDIKEEDILKSCSKLWSILICSSPKHQEWEQQTINSLNKQIHSQGLADSIEIVIDNSTQELGHKRNELSRDALGKYHNFIDPGMQVSDDYIIQIYQVLQSNPDLIIPSTYVGEIDIPLHACPIKRSIALLFTFLERYNNSERHWENMLKKSQTIKIVRYTDKKTLTLKKTNQNENKPLENEAFMYSFLSDGEK